MKTPKKLVRANDLTTEPSREVRELIETAVDIIVKRMSLPGALFAAVKAETIREALSRWHEFVNWQ